MEPEDQVDLGTDEPIGGMMESTARIVQPYPEQRLRVTT